MPGMVNQLDQESLAEAFSAHWERLRRGVYFRLDRRLQGRVDAEDVLQQSYLEASKRLAAYKPEGEHSLFIWLRLIVQQTLVDIHRQHLQTSKRDAKQEESLPRGYDSNAASNPLVGAMTSPSNAAIRDENAANIQAAMQDMDGMDQEILALRHFEELSNLEVAEVLGLSPTAASNRYVRALQRLKKVLGGAS